MKREIVGIVKESEKNQIQELMKSKQALNELVEAASSRFLTEEEQARLKKLVMPDFQDAANKYDQWWQSMSIKYGWQIHLDQCVQIDFATNEVFVHSGCDTNIS